MSLETQIVNKGTVYWVTGLSGAGKTTIGGLFYLRLRASRPNVVFLDGDILRDVFGNDLGHTREERLKSAMRNSRLCKMLSDQGIDVVCATISMFHECRRWNRQHISVYKEIYIRVPMDVLIARDQKKLYSRAGNGEIDNVMGVNLPVDEPENPDVVVDNDGTKSPTEVSENIWHALMCEQS